MIKHQPRSRNYSYDLINALVETDRIMKEIDEIVGDQFDKLMGRYYEMQSKDAQKRSKAWGNKPCSHSNLEEEYYLGSRTGDLVCTTCGMGFCNEAAAKEDALKYKKNIED